jgi:hypothetical protein
MAGSATLWVPEATQSTAAQAAAARRQATLPQVALLNLAAMAVLETQCQTQKQATGLFQAAAAVDRQTMAVAETVALDVSAFGLGKG